MYNKTIEELLPLAILSINDNKVYMQNEEEEIMNKYNGYLASFGPSVIMAGLKQTVLFYADNKKAQDHGIINKIIYETLQKRNWMENANNLSDYVNSDDKQRKKRVLNVVIACKIAIRTLDLEE